ncbi:YbaY family lipoprotein [Agaribacterium haliotis]|uniref:YbaY family lipoprotein n=1 Tax=Agaribacterium haliotis TaxID=2013869 RepID=UPI001304626B|nr:YbaY family lipoprotein [Agaribacterium haliotis]
MKSIPVEVFYRERMALPPSATLTVSLEDVSKQDVAATVIEEQQITLDKAPPYQIKLSYTTSEINSKHRYALRARINNDGKLMFTNTEHIDPFAKAEGETVQVLVRRVPSLPASEKINQSEVKAVLIEGHWELSSLGGLKNPKGASGEALSLKLSEGQANGYGGCNRFMGGYSLEGSKITLGPLASTKMLCQGDGQKNEDLYLPALSQVSSYQAAAESLVFFDKSGNALMSFTRVNKP